MSIPEIILQVTVAALAVIGCYGVFHGILEALFTPRELVSAIVLTESVVPEELDVLLCEARRAPSKRSKRVILALAPELLQGSMGEDGRLYPPYAEVAEKYDATLFVSQDQPTR